MSKRDLSAGYALIKEFEGCELEAYPDPASGNLPVTIAFGSTRKLDGSAWQLGDRVSQEEAEELLRYQAENDFLPELAKIPCWESLTDNQQGALLSFAWNVGANFYGSGGFYTISGVLDDGDFENMRSALLLYVNPGSNVEEGLRRRRNAEADLFESPQ